MDGYKSILIQFPRSIRLPTLEALVAMCDGEGALLHGQLVKFGELRKQRRGGHGEHTKRNMSDNQEVITKVEILKLSGCSEDEKKYEMEHGAHDLA